MVDLRRSHALFLSLALVAVLFSGCAKKTDSNAGTEDDPAKYTDADKFDSAVANNGFQVTGSFAGSTVALTPASAVSLQIQDNAASDGAAAADKASLLLSVQAPGLKVTATMRSMVTAAQAKVPGDLLGGAAQNIRINGATGKGIAALPETKAFFLGVGLARVSINDQTLAANQFVIAAVTLGLRAADGKILTAEDTHDLEFHLIVPGDKIPGNTAVPSVPDGFLYFYFENVALKKLTAAERAEVGKELVPLQAPNKSPEISARILVGGVQANQGTRMENVNLTVTFDATASSDPDGTIEAYSWEILELNRTGLFVPAEVKRATGSNVDYDFSAPGAKIVNLRVIDDDGAIAEASLNFFVNQFTKLPWKGSTLQQAGGGAECIDAVNCNRHEFTVEHSAQKIKFHWTNNGTNPDPTGLTMDFYKPSQANCGTAGSNPTPAKRIQGKDMDVEKALLSEVGRYKLCVWFQAGAAPDWIVETTIFYAPGS